MSELTEQQKIFVDKLVTTSCSPTDAARLAAYADPSVEASRLRRKPHVVAAIKEARKRLIEGDGADKAISTIMSLMDKGVPPATRFAAAKWMAEAAGFGPKTGATDIEDKTLSEMTTAELHALAIRFRKESDEANASAPPMRNVTPNGVSPAH